MLVPHSSEVLIKIFRNFYNQMTTQESKSDLFYILTKERSDDKPDYIYLTRPEELPIHLCTCSNGNFTHITPVFIPLTVQEKFEINNTTPHLFRLPVSCWFDNKAQSFLISSLKEWTDPDFLRKAITVNGMCVKYIPSHLWSEELSSLLLPHLKHQPELLSFLPASAFTPGFCTQILALDGCNIRHFPPYLKTEEYTLLGMQNCMDTLYYGYLSPSTRLELLSRNGHLLEVIPNPTLEEVLVAFHQDPTVLEYISEQYISFEMCEHALMYCPKMAMYVPERYRRELGLNFL